MFTLRCTKKVLDFLQVKPDPSPASTTTVLGDWYVNLFMVGIHQYFMFTNEGSLASVVIEASPDNSWHTKLLDILGKMLAEYGVPFAAIHAERKAMEEFVYARTASRSMLGFMNDFIQFCKMPEDNGDYTDPLTWENHRLLWDWMCRGQYYAGPGNTAKLLLFDADLVMQEKDAILDKILRVEYRAELLTKGKTIDEIEWAVWQNHELPEFAKRSLLQENILDLAGEYGYEGACSPPQYDNIRIVMKDRTVDIVIHDRGMLLWKTEDKTIRRLQKFLIHLIHDKWQS